MARKKLCARCKKVINDGCTYCKSCLTKHKTNSNRFYDKYQRNKDSKFFYNSSSWKSKRVEIFSFYNNLDIYDLYVNNSISIADTIHHIYELSLYPALALDSTNLLPLTSSNHSRIHALYDVDKIGTIDLLHALQERYKHDVESNANAPNAYKA